MRPWELMKSLRQKEKNEKSLGHALRNLTIKISEMKKGLKQEKVEREQSEKEENQQDIVAWKPKNV